jgi:hypothetical protein
MRTVPLASVELASNPQRYRSWRHGGIGTDRFESPNRNVSFQERAALATLEPRNLTVRTESTLSVALPPPSLPPPTLISMTVKHASATSGARSLLLTVYRFAAMTGMRIRRSSFLVSHHSSRCHTRVRANAPFPPQRHGAMVTSENLRCGLPSHFTQSAAVCQITTTNSE